MPGYGRTDAYLCLMIGRIIVFQKAVSGTQVFFFSFFFLQFYISYSIIVTYICMYLAALGLSSSMQDLPSLLWRIGPSVAAKYIHIYVTIIEYEM